jgi:hypothetical protein
MLDDDFFLTAPWTLADFVGPDGAQVLTGAHTCRLLCALALVLTECGRSRNCSADWYISSITHALPCMTVCKHVQAQHLPAPFGRMTIFTCR